jgi:glycosyltransferase involved in cell wall biosynthesis
MLSQAYAAADLLLAPSIVENLPNTVLEAMACGTPAVAYDTGGMRDAVQHLTTGYLARHADPRDLAEGIDALLDDEPLRLRLAEAGRRYIEQEHTQEVQALRFAELYRDVVSARLPAP